MITEALTRFRRRQASMAKRLAEESQLPEPTFYTHCHATVQSGAVELLFWRKDPLTSRIAASRIAIPYDHFITVARALADADVPLPTYGDHDPKNP